jgi:hypothetical protein
MAPPIDQHPRVPTADAQAGTLSVKLLLHVVLLHRVLFH